MRTRILHVARSAALLAGVIIAFPSHAASVSAIWEASGLTDSTLGLTDALLRIEVSYETDASPYFTDDDQATYLPFEVHVTIDDGASVYSWVQSSFTTATGLTVRNDSDDTILRREVDDPKADEISYHGNQGFSGSTLSGYSLTEARGVSTSGFSGTEGGPFANTALPDAGLSTGDFDVFLAGVTFRDPSDGTFGSAPFADGPIDVRTTEYVNAVPIPGAIWLFGSALLGLGALVRRRR